MKYTTIIGILLIAIGLVAAFVAKTDFGDLITDSDFALGLLFGGGSGILIGGFLGWLYKKKKVEVVKVEVPEADTTTE